MVNADITLEEVLQSTSDVLFPAEMGEKRVEICSSGVDGDTPLHVVVWRGDIKAARILIAAGADVNAVGDMSETPLHVAVRKKCSELIDALLKAGAESDIRSEFGETPREMAARDGGLIWHLFR